MRRFGSCCLLVLAVGGCLVAVSRLDAASFALTPGEREDAIRTGKRSVVSGAFDAEWTVSGPGAGEALMVMTPFHRLALAARNSAFKSEELRPQDVEALLKGEAGTLTVWATLRGGKADFARSYAPLLVRGRDEIKPSFTQNERTARREENGSYTARCMYVFPSTGLKPDDTVTVLVKDPDDKPVAKFTVDLSTMR